MRQNSVWDYIYEPEAKVVLDQVLTRYIETIVYQAVAENMASEQSARMVAMKAASDNAESVIDELTLIYNKNRQANITKELSEIVGERQPYEWSMGIRAPSRYGCRVTVGFADSFELEEHHGTGTDPRHHRPVYRRGDGHQFAREDARYLRRAHSEDTGEAGLAEKGLTFEVEQQLGDGVVRCIALGSSDGLRRGMKVRGTGAPISVPVGKATLGRIMDVLGRPIDEGGPIQTDTRRSIHQAAPKFDELSPSVELLSRVGSSTSSAPSPRAARSASSAARASARR